MSPVDRTDQLEEMPDKFAAKVLALLAYIGCGSVALKRGRSKAVRGIFFVMALSCFAYIVSVALTRHPAGFFAGL